LLDWQMPGVSGLDVCRFLRERHDEVSLPILMLTARGAKHDFAEGLSAGANDYVSKPYDDAELLARVRGLVRTRQQARAMRQREEWFATTLGSIADGVIATDEDGHVTFLNRAAELLTGWQSGEALGRAVEEVFRIENERTGTPERILLERVPGNAAPQPSSGAALLLRKDGSRLPIEESIGAIGPSAQQGAVVVFRDATDRRRAAAEIARRMDFEEKLIGIVSHDLRSPLHVIGMAAQALSRATDSPALAEQLAARIRSSAERATRLVNDLLDFTQARLGNGIPVRRVPMNLHQLVEQVLEDIRAETRSSTLIGVVRGDGQGEWDSDRLAQVLTNLVSNALSYGDPAAPVTVLCSGEEQDWVTLAVHNRGTPITQEILEGKMFEPLLRGSSSTSSSKRSVGLGLYIVKQIVHAHAGTLSVDSAAGRGTTFTLRLPRRG
ncbi:MAG TPA: ATP-binding protein, partial [Polyangiaceae bacterium]|nr:ATP-binding protein [Polyangiaceae bacterium]